MLVYFGENLKKLRKDKNMTQEALAEFLGVSFQAVSKWERNESYPDITMLPAIASFFGVTIDKLLGTERLKQEEKIRSYIDEYYRLWSEHNIIEVKKLMKQAISEFPGNYDLLSRYMNALIYAQREDEYLVSIKSEVQSVYDAIQSYCTVDSIRIWAKKIMCRYLRDLSFIKNSRVSIEDAEKILSELPIMQNTRDYEAMYMYPYDKEKRSVACANGMSEMLRLFGEILNRKYDSPVEYDEKVLESFLSLLHSVMPDEDFGKCFHHVVYDYGYLGVQKYLKGDAAGALKCFRKEAEYAGKYDALPEITTHTSFLVEGLDFDKSKTLMGADSLRERVKSVMLNRYPLSDEFKSSREFAEIIEMLG